MTTLKHAVSMAAETLATTLPHWDMTTIFPGLQSPEFEAGFRHVTESIDGLTELFDRHNVRLLTAEEQSAIRHQSSSSESAIEEVITRFNAVLEEYRTISAYIQCILSTDTRDSVALHRASEMQAQGVRISQLGTRWTAWIGSLDVEALIERSQVARDHAFNLRKAHRRAQHLMSPAEENLASELYLSGGSGWEKLHMSVSSQLAVTVEMPGRRASARLPMSVVRNLAFDPDREVRRRAYEAELGGLEEGRRAPGRRPQRREGRGQHPLAPPPLGLGARRSPLRQQYRPPDPRRHDGGRPRIVPRLPPLYAHSRPHDGHRAPGLVRYLRARGGQHQRLGLRGRQALHRRAVRQLIRASWRALPTAPSAKLDRRRAAPRQARRRILHAHPQRRICASSPTTSRATAA